MLGKTHRAFGFAISGTLLCGAYSYLPGFVPETQVPLLAGQALVMEMGAVLSATWPDRAEHCLGGISAHRGLTHTIWPIFFFIAIALWQMDHPLLYALFFGLSLGWFSHILGDSFSVAGDAWFYPFQGYRRYSNGAFYVKGPRGIFQPLYRTGDSAFSFMPVIWWILGFLATCFFFAQIGG